MWGVIFNQPEVLDLQSNPHQRGHCLGEVSAGPMPIFFTVTETPDLTSIDVHFRRTYMIHLEAGNGKANAITGRNWTPRNCCRIEMKICM